MQNNSSDVKFEIKLDGGIVHGDTTIIPQIKSTPREMNASHLNINKLATVNIETPNLT